MNSIKATDCDQMNVLSENSQCLSRSVSGSSLKKLDEKMTYEDAKQACMDEDMIIWLPDNLVEQNEVAKLLDERGLLEAGDEIWLRLTFDEGNDSCLNYRSLFMTKVSTYGINLR